MDMSTFAFTTIFILTWVAGFIFGKIHTLYQMQKQVKSTAERLGIDLDEMAQNLHKSISKINIVPRFFTEVEQNSIYLYDKDTNKFIGQGLTLDDLAVRISESNINLAFIKHQNENFIFDEGKIVKYEGEDRKV